MARLRTFVYSLDVGEIVVQWPDPLPADADDLDVIMKWFALIERQLAKRPAESVPPKEQG